MLRAWVTLALLAAAPVHAAPPLEQVRRIDLDVKDADIHNLMRLFSEYGQVNILIPEEIRGAVTVRMRDVPWQKAMQVILRSRDYFFT